MNKFEKISIEQFKKDLSDDAWVDRTIEKM